MPCLFVLVTAADILDIEEWVPFSKPDDSSLAEQNGWAYKIGVTAK